MLVSGCARRRRRRMGPAVECHRRQTTAGQVHLSTDPPSRRRQPPRRYRRRLRASARAHAPGVRAIRRRTEMRRRFSCRLLRFLTQEYLTIEM